MRITVNNAGKRFNRDWIFRNINQEFTQGNHYAVTGHNGSGKSTFLQCVAGALYINEGLISFSEGNTAIKPDEQFKYLSICAPYLEVIEEMTPLEFLTYHKSFKPLISGADEKSILHEIGLSHAQNKQIRHFSSGMKQRIKLAQAFFTEAPVLLLDEPCTNLDQKGFDLYSHLINTYCADRLVLISSNDPNEYQTCTSEIRMGV